MNYRVTLTKTAVKERSRLVPPNREWVDHVLLELGKDPRPSGVKRLSGSIQDWRVRVGDYRILYEVDDEAQIITVWREAYR